MLTVRRLFHACDCLNQFRHSRKHCSMPVLVLPLVVVGYVLELIAKILLLVLEPKVGLLVLVLATSVLETSLLDWAGLVGGSGSHPKSGPEQA